MKKYIAIISRTDETGGGASRIAAGLTKLLNTTSDFEAHHWVGTPGPNSNWWTYKLHGGKWLSALHGIFSVGSRKLGFPDFFTPELFIHLSRKKVNYSLYHFHDITSTLSPLALNWLAKTKSCIWTLHDCSPFTGGCITPLGCNVFRDGCTNCPQLSEPPLGTPYDFTGAMQAFKARLIKNTNISLVAPSNWLIDEMHKSQLFKKPVFCIPNFVDTKVFRPIDKKIVRQILGLPQEQFIVLLSSTNLTDKHKGVRFGIDALSQLNRKPFVLAIGTNTKSSENILCSFEHHKTGYIYNDNLLAQYYAAADVLVFPTLADNLPTVIIENMACGTPCIAFRTGGVPEIIDHGVTGWLVDQMDVNGLSEAISMCMENRDLLKEWAANGLIKANKIYNADAFLDAYIRIYNELLNQSEPREKLKII